MMEILQIINDSWNWLKVEAMDVIDINKFGNIVFQNKDESIWRICPEELYCEKIANSKTDFLALKNQPEFMEDWEMTKFVEIAEAKYCIQNENRVFCLKHPAVLGGAYDADNISTISLKELIRFSGDLAFQIKDLKNGQNIKLTTINGE